MKIGGIDVGTTGCKLVVYDEKGCMQHREYIEYEISRSFGEHEIDADSIWQSVKELIKKTALAVGNIDAIGITTFGEAFVLLDENDRVLCPSMLYTDPRGEREAKSFNPQTVMEIAGVKPHSMYSLPKLMWIKVNRPEIFEKAKRVMLFEDFLVYKLTGVAQIDSSLAARTMALDIRKCDWSDELLAFAGIGKEKFSKVVLGGTIAGKIKKALENELQLFETIIVNGCHDQVASAVGAGALSSGIAVDGTGTVECITPIFDTIPENLALYENNYAVVPFAVKGKYVCYAFSFTGGAAVKWFRDELASDMSYAQLDLQIGNKCGNILLLPHFAGAATPYMDPYSKAAFLGITLETTRADLYRAIMEGVTYEIRLNLEKLANSGITPDKLYATGGGALSSVWLQMKADILGLPITSLDAPEVGAAGTVMLTGTAIGAFKDLDTAKKVMIKEKDTFFPNTDRQAEYEKQFLRYKKLYSTVRPLMDEEV